LGKDCGADKPDLSTPYGAEGLRVDAEQIGPELFAQSRAGAASVSGDGVPLGQPIVEKASARSRHIQLYISIVRDPTQKKVK